MVAAIKVGYFPTGVAVTRNGTRAYVTNSYLNNLGSPGSISVIDTARRRVVDTISVGGKPDWNRARSSDRFTERRRTSKRVNLCRWGVTRVWFRGWRTHQEGNVSNFVDYFAGGVGQGQNLAGADRIERSHKAG